MALVLLTEITPVAPASLADYVAQNELLEASFLHGQDKINFDSDLILEGSIFNIGGSVYRADADTAITGVASDYVKITPAGATASAAYVSNLTGVTWNSAYNGYYDVGGNLYLFDEGKALYNAQIATVFGRYAMQQKSGDVYCGRDLYLKRHLTISGNIVGNALISGLSTIGGTLGVTGAETAASHKNDNVFLKWKLFTGNLDGNGDANFAHGITVTKIIGTIYSRYNGTYYITFSSLALVYCTATNIVINDDAGLAGRPYRLALFYEA